MSVHKPRPLWPLVTTALIGLPVLYVASFGPACWYIAGGEENRLVQAIYWPAGRLIWYGPSGLHRSMTYYWMKNAPRHVRAINLPVGPEPDDWALIR